MGRKKPEREEKEEEEGSSKKVGPGLKAPRSTAPSSAPVTLAPSQGSISGILFARGLFVRNFRKKGQIVKNLARDTRLRAAL